MSVLIDSATTNYFDFSVGYNYYTRQQTINDTSSYKPGGAALVSPIQYTCTSPSGITSSGTITPSAPVALVKNMGLLGASIEVGTYTVYGLFTDQDGTEYELTKTVNLCLPNQDATASGANGTVTLGWTVRCIDNLIIVADQTSMVLTVNSTVFTASSKTYAITCVNPLGVILAAAVNVPSFQITPIVNGQYSINIDDTAIFTIGDGITVTVHFKLTGAVKQAQCNINLCDVYCAVDSVYTQWLAIQGNGSIQERTLKEKWQQLALLIGLAEIAITCGNDLDAILVQIEEISGVTCSCGCGITNVNQGVNVAVGQNIVVQSGGGDTTVSSTTVGNTTTWTVADKHYVLSIPNDGSQAYLAVTTTTVGDTTTFSLAFTTGDFNNIIDNTTVAVANTTTAAETLLSQAIAANTLAANEAEIQWETMYEMVSATDKLTRVLNVTINGETLFTKTISGASAMANVAIVKGKIIRPSNTTAYAYTTVEYYNLNEFVTKEINIAPTSLAGTWNWTTTGYTILVRTTQATVNVIKANYLNVEVFRPV